MYISDFKRSLVDKLSKNFFSEPSQVRHNLQDGTAVEYTAGPLGQCVLFCPCPLHSFNAPEFNKGLRYKPSSWEYGR